MMCRFLGHLELEIKHSLNKKSQLVTHLSKLHLLNWMRGEEMLLDHYVGCYCIRPLCCNGLLETHLISLPFKFLFKNQYSVKILHWFPFPNVI